MKSTKQVKKKTRRPTPLELVKYANDCHYLLSLLYDLDLMPEQVRKGSAGEAKMLCIIWHFKYAMEAMEAKP